MPFGHGCVILKSSQYLQLSDSCKYYDVKTQRFTMNIRKYVISLVVFYKKNNFTIIFLAIHSR